MRGFRTAAPARTIWATALVWLLCAAGLLYYCRGFVWPFGLRDPDDAMRLVEVRDWMAGQSWFDTTQYRSFPPAGAPMHWSRLVDVPIAGAIALFSLVAPPLTAQWLATIAVPLALLLALFLALHALTVRMTGRPVAGVLAATMAATSMGALTQFMPLRIDHHGWQILLGVLAIIPALGPETRGARRGLRAGLVMAGSLTVSLESLPLAAALGALFALRYASEGGQWRDLSAYLGALVLGCAGLALATLGPVRAIVGWCDAMSPAYLAPLAVAAILAPAGAYACREARPPARLAILAFAAGGSAVAYVLAAPQCLGGPFAQLDPLVYRLWYGSVPEGLPLWTQAPDLRILLPLPSLLGLAGAALAARYDAPGRRRRWLELLFLQLAATALSILVMRAVGLAHTLAVPGTAWLFLTALARATRLGTPVARVLAGTACFLLTPVGVEIAGLAAIAVAGPTGADGAEKKRSDESHWACLAPGAFMGLNALPPAILFTPVDMGSHVLAYTRHSVVATGHHRNRAGMRAVLLAFSARPDAARAVIATTPARYVVVCPLANEMKKFAGAFPGSLGAMLEHGRAPGWLTPVAAGGGPLRIYRIAPPAQPAVKRSATPFMQ